MSEEQYQLNRPVFFIGFMGAGKTSVARRLARLCSMSSVDMDTYIERREGKKITAIFDEGGESGFRSIETDVLRELIEQENAQIISCGGGIVVTEENHDLLKDGGYVIYLEVTADEAAERIGDASSRPMFQNLEVARARNAERTPLYQRAANATINTAGKSVTTIAHEARQILEQEGVLCQQPA